MKRVHVPTPKKQNGLKKPEKHVHGKSHKAERAREVRLGMVAVKQNAVMTKIAENVKNGIKQPVAVTQEESGYSAKYTHMKDTDAWQALMEKHIPDSLLAKVHEEGLSAMRGAKNPIPDYTARHKYLDSGYKLKKRYDTSITIKGYLGQLSPEELDAAIAGEISKALGTLTGEE